MSGSKIVLIGLVGVGFVAVLAAAAHAASSSASSPPSADTLPANYQPPAGSRVASIPAGAVVPFGVTKTSWDVQADASGQRAGTFTLFQRTQSPRGDWLVTFSEPGASAGGVVAYSQTPNGGLLAQAAAAGL